MIERGICPRITTFRPLNQQYINQVNNDNPNRPTNTAGPASDVAPTPTQLDWPRFG